MQALRRHAPTPVCGASISDASNGRAGSGPPHTSQPPSAGWAAYPPGVRPKRRLGCLPARGPAEAPRCHNHPSGFEVLPRTPTSRPPPTAVWRATTVQGHLDLVRSRACLSHTQQCNRFFFCFCLPLRTASLTCLSAGSSSSASRPVDAPRAVPASSGSIARSSRSPPIFSRPHVFLLMAVGPFPRPGRSLGPRGRYKWTDEWRWRCRRGPLGGRAGPRAGPRAVRCGGGGLNLDGGAEAITRAAGFIPCLPCSLDITRATQAAPTDENEQTA